MKPLHRRDLLKTTAVGAASLLGTSRSWAGANDRIRLAVIGMGGRGGSVMKTVAALDNIEVVTLCDPDENRMRERAGELEARTGKKPKLEPDLRRIRCGFGHTIREPRAKKPFTYNVVTPRMTLILLEFNTVYRMGGNRSLETLS